VLEGLQERKKSKDDLDAVKAAKGKNRKEQEQKKLLRKICRSRRSLKAR
jgi:hypothetical protein